MPKFPPRSAALVHHGHACATCGPNLATICGSEIGRRGSPSTKIVPLLGDHWVSGDRIKLIFDSPTDPDWDSERRAFGVDEISDLSSNIVQTESKQVAICLALSGCHCSNRFGEESFF
jgi:hypothetical protein